MFLTVHVPNQTVLKIFRRISLSFPSDLQTGRPAPFHVRLSRVGVWYSTGTDQKSLMSRLIRFIVPPASFVQRTIVVEEPS